MLPNKSILEKIKKDLPYRPEIFIEIAKKIQRKNRRRPILLMMSGGVDSEIVGHFLLEAGVEFMPVIVGYENGYNDYDINWAKNWCAGNSLEYIQLNLDVEKYLSSTEYRKIKKQINMGRPFNPTLFPILKAAYAADFFCITGCGEPYISVDSGGVHEHFAPQGFGLKSWTKMTGNENLYGEFLRNQKVRNLFVDSAKMVYEKWKLNLTCEELKGLVYERHFKYVRRPKYSGFEFLVVERPITRDLLCPPGFAYLEKTKKIKV